MARVLRAGGSQYRAVSAAESPAARPITTASSGPPQREREREKERERQSIAKLSGRY